MESALIIKHGSPHVKRKDNLTWFMLDVIIALTPVVVFSFVAYPLGALKNVLISIASIEFCELLFVFITNPLPVDLKKHSIKERIGNGLKHYKLSNFLSAMVTSLIYAMILPSSASWYAVMAGGIAGITLGKLLFGGLGNNLFNPAAIGMVFSKICFGSTFSYESTWLVQIDAVARGTSLGTYGAYSALDLFLGFVPGTIGEGCKIAILIGLAYLLVRRVADYRVVLSYSLTFVSLMAVAGLTLLLTDRISDFSGYFLWQILSGGFFFGCAFMITDPVTMPITAPSRYIYGIVGATAAVFIRLFAALPEGVGYGILIANCLASALDYPKWSDAKWKKKDTILVITIALFAIAIIIIAGKNGGIKE